MARLRWTLVLIALGIGLPALLIVQRAAESLALENAYRHQAVAERVFDEMERTLSDFLLREESRRPGHYAALPEYAGPHPSRVPEAPVSLPFRDVDDPFVLGWFSLDGDGTLRTLARPGNPPGSHIALDTAIRGALAAGAPTPRLDDFDAFDAFDRIDDLEAFEAREARGAKDSDARTAERSALAGPAPGRTQTLGRDRKEGADLGALDALALEEEVESTPYDVLQNLNRASSLRSERQSKTASQRSTDSFAFARKRAAGAGTPDRDQAMAASPPALEGDAAVRPAPAASPPGAAAQAAETTGQIGRRAASTAPPLDHATREPGFDDAAADRETPEAIVDPFLGRVTPTGQIVLARSVWLAGEATRQGVVLDRDRLVDWLRGSILRDAGLAQHATLDFAGPAISGSGPAPNPEPFRYLHRFAEPFDGLLAHLELEPLPGFQTTRSLYGLAGLLALALVIGLLAVDRMTRVVLEYAERRNNFVAAVSHELRTPLTAIRMYGEMLRDGLVASDAKRAQYHAAITDESERLSRLIDNVLEFSRLEQQRRPLDLVAGGLDETVRTASEKLRAHVEREGFTLELALEPPHGRVQYDRDAVTQIVFNLVDNALKYARQDEHETSARVAAPARPGRIEVSLHEAEQAIVLSVRDSGPGVPADQLRRIFEPFYRIGNELTRTAEGTGIGLALVKDLAEAMNARVEARSPADGGFEVRIRFASAD